MKYLTTELFSSHCETRSTCQTGQRMTLTPGSAQHLFLQDRNVLPSSVIKKIIFQQTSQGFTISPKTTLNFGDFAGDREREYWGLNSRRHTCLAGALPLESLRQPFLLWLFLR
jgi:hypothetical protein